VPEGGSFTGVQGTLSAVTVPDTITLQAPATYVPGVPVLVRVDARLPGGALERNVWNRTASLTAPNGLTLNPSTITLYNGSGSALVSVGSTVGGAVRPLVLEGGTSAAPVAGAPAWRILDSGTEPSATWRSDPAFDDSLWRQGLLHAGAGDGDERTVVNNVSSAAASRKAFYFRQAFTVTDTTPITTLRLRAVVDDGAVFYLNGTEVYRDNLPAGALTLDTAASSNRSASPIARWTPSAPLRLSTAGRGAPVMTPRCWPAGLRPLPSRPCAAVPQAPHCPGWRRSFPASPSSRAAGSPT